MKEKFKDLIFNSNKKINKMIIDMLILQEILNKKELSKEEKNFIENEKDEIMNCFKIEFRKNNVEEIKKYKKLNECKE